MRAVNASPKARSEKILVQDLEGEVIVYDTGTDQVHCLNPLAAAIWKRCDGHTSVAKLSAAASIALDRNCSVSAVKQMLQELEQAGLMESVVQVPESSGVSRRQMMATLGVAAAVVTVLAPTAAMAASPPAGCLPNGDQGCGINNALCCSNQCVNGVCV